jgi:hypothetical protein
MRKKKMARSKSEQTKKNHLTQTVIQQTINKLHIQKKSICLAMNAS